jgi:hypothetical protein
VYVGDNPAPKECHEKPRTGMIAHPATMTDDTALIEASCERPELFAEFYDRHAEEIHRYIARRLGPDVGDDLMAETFLLATGLSYKEVGQALNVTVGTSLTDLGRRVEAVAQLRAAVAVFRQFGDQRSEALALVPLGDLLRHFGGPTAAARSVSA